MERKPIFTGAASALITPMTSSGVDYENFRKLINWQIEEGIDALVIAGTSGEGSTLTDEEHREVLKFAVEVVDGRVPVIGGTGSNSSFFTLDLAKEAAQMEREVVPEEKEDKGKAALTALFQSVRNEKTPVIVERIVGDIDGIVKIVRFDGWQNVPTGRKMISRNLRDVIMRKYRIRDTEVFDKAYSYVEQYY